MKFKNPNLNVLNEQTDGRINKRMDGQAQSNIPPQFFTVWGIKRVETTKLRIFLRQNHHITGSRHLTSLTVQSFVKAPPIICSRRQFQILPFFFSKITNKA